MFGLKQITLTSS